MGLACREDGGMMLKFSDLCLAVCVGIFIGLYVARVWG